MQYVADTALANHGADDGSERRDRRPRTRATKNHLYVVELPTKTVEESLGQAVGLGLRKDPDQETVSGLQRVAARRRRFTGALLVHGGGREDDLPPEVRKSRKARLTYPGLAT